MNQNHFDFIIVGQGLAGTLLTHFLIERGKSVFVIDNHNPSSSSNIAAGIIHPITGRRLVKTWLFDEAYPFARATYAGLEKKFATHFFKEIAILEIYTSIKNRNDWLERSSNAGYEKLIGDELHPNFNPSVNCPYGAVKLFPTGFLYIKNLLSAYKELLLSKNKIGNEGFKFENLKINENGIEYKNYSAEKIIFCEGYYAFNNPFFAQLPFRFAKGEVIIVKCDGLRDDYIINKAIYIQPLGDDLFRVGSTYDWDQLNDEPTEAAEKKLTEQFAAIITLPFKVENHLAAMRPTMKNRRPVIGFHHTHNNVGIFNGLGTKGVLLAPYLAHHFAEHLESNTALLPEVQINNYGY